MAAIVHAMDDLEVTIRTGGLGAEEHDCYLTSTNNNQISLEKSNN
jgi:hypothetical protein